MPVMPTDTRDQHIADLREALDHAVRLLYFAAGREVAGGDVQEAARLCAAAGSMTDTLARTTPDQS